MTQDNQDIDQVFELVAGIALSFGSAARLKILHLLSQAPRRVEEIAKITGETVANVSQHLQRLLNENVVLVRKEKLTRIYSVKSEKVSLLLDDLFALATEISSEVSQAEQRIVDFDLYDEHNVSEVLDKVKAKRASFIDVRDAHETSHTTIEGAVSVDHDQIAELAKTLAKTKTYYLICRGRFCPMANQSVKLLRSLGIKAYRLKESPTKIRSLMSGRPRKPHQ